MAMINKEKNARLPIHRLPLEVMSHILRSSFRPYSSAKDEERGARLLELASVCSSWASLVRSNPGLWNQISSSDPYRSLALSKSGSVALSVILSTVNEDEPVPLWLEKLHNEPQRLRSLSILQASPALAKAFLRSPLPSLIALRIHHEWAFLADGEPLPRHYDIPALPTLHKLKFSSMSVTLVGGLGPQLRSLTLNSCVLHDCSLEDAIAKCPALEYLELTRLETNGSSSSTSPREPILLPNLRELYMHDIESEDIVRCLPVRIRSPRLKSLHVIGDYSPQGAEMIEALTDPTCTLLQTITQDVEVVSISLTEDYITMSDEPRSAMEIRLHCDDPVVQLVRRPLLLSKRPSTKLRLDVEDSDSALFITRARIVCLELCRGPLGIALMEYMTPAIIPERILCRHLSVIKLKEEVDHTPDELQAMANLILKRCALAASGADVAPLRYLDVNNREFQPTTLSFGDPDPNSV